MTSHAELLRGNGICLSTVLARRTAANDWAGFDLAHSQVQDWDLWLRLTRDAGGR